MNAKTGLNRGLDYSRAIEIAKGVFWVGYSDTLSGLHCNPYIIIDNDEAVVIDGGSRPDFPTVMMKILQTGIDPSRIKALIYQHYDPDLCGSIPNYEDIVSRADLKIISDAENNIFIRHYSVTAPLISIDSLGYTYQFSSGRTLQFISTPYAHSPGSFVTFDQTSGILFTSDIFGSIGSYWELYLELTEDCRSCTDLDSCPQEAHCPFQDIFNFHRVTMTSERALGYALEQIASVDFSILAPQHGSLIVTPRDIITLVEKLKTLKEIGIDWILGHGQRPKTTRIDNMIQRLGGSLP